MKSGARREEKKGQKLHEGRDERKRKEKRMKERRMKWMMVEIQIKEDNNLK